MKTGLRILGLLLLICLAHHASGAEQDIVGTWQGKLQIDPSTALTIQFTFTKKPDGKYSAVLNSPDNGGIKNMPADSVSWSQGALKVQVAALSGSFAGGLKGNTIEGKWTQPGGAIPLVLNPYEKPQIAKADIDKLAGNWHGPVKIPAGALTMVLRFKVSDTGELTGTFSVPEQGGQETALSDIEFAKDQLGFKIPPVVQFNATYANGVLDGKWKQPNPGFPADGLPVTLKKGEFTAPVYALKLSSESFAALQGRWEGAVDAPNPQGGTVSLPVVLRFETDTQAQIVGYVDSPAAKVSGIPVTEVSLAAGKLVVKVGGLNAEYRGDLSGKTATGEWTQGPFKAPLTLTRK